MCFCWSSWRNPSLPRWRLVNRNREKLFHWSPPHQMNKLDDQHHGSAIHAKLRSKPSSYEGNFSAAHRTSIMDRSQCDAPDGWERWESQTLGTVFSVECFWIVDFILNGPSKQLPPGFHGNSVGIFLILKKKMSLCLDSKKSEIFFSNVRSPNHPPGKSSVVTGTLDTWWNVFIIKALAPATLGRICDLSIYHLLHDPYSPGEIIRLGKDRTET